MKNIGGYFFAGGIGALIGSGLTFLFYRKRYNQILSKKVDETKIEKLKYERLVAKYGPVDEPVKKKEEIKKEVVEDEFDSESTITAPVTEKVDYSAISRIESSPAETKTKPNAEPYVIGLEESKASPAGSVPGYDYIYMTYYADGVLADDKDDPVEHPIDILGEDWKNRFGEVEADMVYVRNDNMECDYEITKDSRPYSEVVGEV